MTTPTAQLSMVGLALALAAGANGCKRDLPASAPAAAPASGAAAKPPSADGPPASGAAPARPAGGPEAAAGPCFDRAACEAACKGGDGRGCRRWGELLTGGWSGDATDGRAAWSAGCALGDAACCLSLVGEPANAEALARAVAAGTRACDAGDGEACLYRAAMVAYGESEEVRSSGKTQREKRRWSVKACQAGHTSACDAVALLSAMAPETEGDEIHEAPPAKALALCRSGALEVCESLVAAGDDQSEAAYAVLAEHCPGAERGHP